MTKLIDGIKAIMPGKVIHLLLQHPNPSPAKDNRSKLFLLFESLNISLQQGVLHDVIFVYDFATNRNTWSKETLKSLYMMRNCNECEFNVSEQIIVSNKGDDNVKHPLFGKTKRYGWAAMRNCDEYSFSISYRKTIQ